MKKVPLSGHLISLLGVFICMAYMAPKLLPGGNNLLESIAISGSTTTRFVYDAARRISEIESIHGWQRFSYDASGRLVKQESAQDPSMLSGTAVPGKIKKPMMTAQNSTPAFYDVFEYTATGQLTKIKHYFKERIAFEYRSFTQLAYVRRSRR